jgi:hypothetical protein
VRLLGGEELCQPRAESTSWPGRSGHGSADIIACRFASAPFPGQTPWLPADPRRPASRPPVDDFCKYGDPALLLRKSLSDQNFQVSCPTARRKRTPSARKDDRDCHGDARGLTLRRSEQLDEAFGFNICRILADHARQATPAAPNSPSKDERAEACSRGLRSKDLRMVRSDDEVHHDPARRPSDRKSQVGQAQAQMPRKTAAYRQASAGSTESCAAIFRESAVEALARIYAEK